MSEQKKETGEPQLTPDLRRQQPYSLEQLMQGRIAEAEEDQGQNMDEGRVEAALTRFNATVYSRLQHETSDPESRADYEAGIAIIKTIRPDLSESEISLFIQENPGFLYDASKILIDDNKIPPTEEMATIPGYDQNLKTFLENLISLYPNIIIRQNNNHE